jgi:hypothetical protein
MNLEIIEKTVLKNGSHASFEAGACAMELVSYLASEPWSDRPKCVSEVLGAFVRRINDCWSDDERQLLKPYLARLIGTNDGKEKERGHLLAHRAITVIVPLAFDKRFPEHAAKIRAVKFGDWDEARAVCQAARNAAVAAAAAAAYAVADADAYAAADAATYADAVAAAAADAVAATDADADAAAAAYADAVAATDAVADAAAVAAAYAAAYADAYADAAAATYAVAGAVADADAAAHAAAYAKRTRILARKPIIEATLAALNDAIDLK